MLRRHFTSYLLSNNDSGLVPGFVDLGLSVMWASCDVGASSPELEGAKYAWGEESWNTIPLESDPVYMNSDMEWKEVLRPRTPSPAQVQELLDNTTATEEVLNGVEGVRYTAANGNSIFISNTERWTNAEKWKVDNWRTAIAVHWSPSEGIIDNDGGASSTYKSDLLLFRGICSCLPQGGATLLKYDKSVVANSSQLYAISKTWRKATQFIIDGASNVEMQISNSHLFDASNSNVFVNTYSPSLHNEGNAVAFTSAELITLIDKMLDNYLYIRFVASSDFTLTPKLWDISEGVDKTQILYPNQTFVAKKGGNPTYRIPYSLLENCDMTINWEGSSRIYIYFGDTCTFAMSKTNEHVFNYVYLGSDGTYDISAETIDTWKDRVDEYGYLYVRFNPNNAGYMTLNVVKRAPSNPSILSSTLLEPSAGLMLS